MKQKSVPCSLSPSLSSALCCPPGALNGQIELGSQQWAPPKKRALLGGRSEGWKKGGNNITTALRY